MTEIPFEFPSLEAAKDYWSRLRPKAPKEAIAQRVEKTMRVADDGSVHWRFDVRGIRETRINPDPNRVTDLAPIAARIKVPTLVLRGENSDFLPVETCKATSQNNPKIEWAQVPDASHYVHDDNFESFISHVEAFFAE